MLVGPVPRITDMDFRLRRYTFLATGVLWLACSAPNGPTDGPPGGDSGGAAPTNGGTSAGGTAPTSGGVTMATSGGSSSGGAPSAGATNGGASTGGSSGGALMNS